MELITADTKYAVLKYILDRPDSRIKVVEIAKATGTSKGYVSKIVEALRKDSLVDDGNKLDTSNPKITVLKILINVNRLADNGVPDRLRKLDVSSAGIYGSWASGKNNQESDIDIWIKPSGHIKDADIAAVSRYIRETMGINPQILVLSRDRLNQIKRENTLFYHSLIFGSIKLFGGEIE